MRRKPDPRDALMSRPRLTRFICTILDGPTAPHGAPLMVKGPAMKMIIMPEQTQPFKIPMGRPCISEADIAAVTSVLRSGSLSLGPKVVEFERAVADYVGCPYAVAVNSGTSGL